MASPSSSTENGNNNNDDDDLLFLKEHHVAYFASALEGLPGAYAKLDTNRLTLVHFATHALDVLGVWESPELLERYQVISKHHIQEWIYSLQLPTGFQGGPYVGRGGRDKTTEKSTEKEEEEEPCECYPQHNTDDNGVAEYRQSHIAMTYTALCTLTVLRDDNDENNNDETPFGRRLNKQAILENLSKLQRPDGSFQCTTVPSEHDMRFLYCACAICYMLNDFSTINLDAAVEYIKSCRAYDGAIALIPGQVSTRISHPYIISLAMLCVCVSEKNVLYLKKL
jgi:geranylgeranyl transferase type-1 subunit beta